MEIDKRRILVSCLVIILGLAVYAVRNWPFRKHEEEIVVETESAATVEETTTESTTVSKSPVYICGAIKHPGIYELELPVYLYELIDLAGGLSETADREKIDLVYRIESTQSIFLPSTQDTEESEERQWNDFAEISPTSWNETKSPGKVEEGMVNINTAGLEELCTLPGIGQKTAESIISYRQEHGPFSEPGDIMQVSGIGESKYGKIKDRISV